jgi:hypothetical protein
MQRQLNPQAGSAYIIALLALVVLSIIGLGLALITQTEMQIGSNERTLQKVFYAADTGVQMATARAIVVPDLTKFTVSLKDNEKVLLKHDVAMSPFYPLMQATCNLCEFNDPGEYKDQYKKVNFGVTAVATRKTVLPSSDVLASKTLSSLVEVQPIQLTNETMAKVLSDPAALDQIKF